MRLLQCILFFTFFLSLSSCGGTRAQLESYKAQKKYTEGLAYCESQELTPEILSYMGQFSFALHEKEKAYAYLLSAYYLSSQYASKNLAILARDNGNIEVLLEVLNDMDVIDDECRYLQFQAYTITNQTQKAHEILVKYLGGSLSDFDYVSLFIKAKGDTDTIVNLLETSEFSATEINKLFALLYQNNMLNTSYLDFLKNAVQRESLDKVVQSNLFSYIALIYENEGDRVMARMYHNKALKLNAYNTLSAGKI
jgi:tetratricopeptide (TPR) repeat protein